MNEEILKLARDSGLTCYGGSHQSSGHHSWHAYTPHIEAFYRAAYNKAIEDAAKVLGEAWEDARKEYEGYGSTGNQCNPYYAGYADCADISTTEIRGLTK